MTAQDKQTALINQCVSRKLLTQQTANQALKLSPSNDLIETLYDAVLTLNYDCEFFVRKIIRFYGSK